MCPVIDPHVISDKSYIRYGVLSIDGRSGIVHPRFVLAFFLYNSFAGRILQLERTIEDFKRFYPKRLASTRDNATKREYQKLLAERAEIS